ITRDIRRDEEELKAEASAAGTREIIVDPLVTGDISESTKGGIPDLEDTIYDIVHYMSELVASGERAGLADRVRSLGRDNLSVRALLCIERDRVDGLRRHMALSQEEFRQVHRDRDDTRRRLRRLESLVERRLGFRRYFAMIRKAYFDSLTCSSLLLITCSGKACSINMTITRSGMTPKAIEGLINQRVEDALATYEAAHAANALEAKSQSQNGSDGDNENGGNGNCRNGNGGNGNGNGNGGRNGHGNHNR
ncbi:hypothetical protein Tco_0082436, partial [Tanacetum coccineum]